MKVYVEFEDSSIGVLSYKAISKLSFICSIFKIFAMGHLVINDFAKRAFNLIKSGMPVNIVFVDEKGKEYINRMKILSFTKIPSMSFKDTLDLTLISSIYFDDSFGTNVYEGSVGSIIDVIMSKFFKRSVDNYKGIITDDPPRRRYQVSEKTLDFMKRILKYGIKDNFPVYLFHDARGNLNLRGFREMAKTTPEYTISMVGYTLPEQTKSSNESEIPFTMYDFVSAFDGRKACSEITTKFSAANFRFQNKVQSSYTFKSVESQSNQVFDKTPKKVKFSGWNLTPTDALSIAAKESFEETYNTCVFKATFRGLDVDNLELGKTFNINLPFDNSAKNSLGQNSNLGEGRYLVTDLEFVLNESSVQTVASMIQVTC